MIKVTIGNNVKRTTVILDENTTLRQALEDADIDYSRGTMNLGGSSLGPGDLDKTFADFGVVSCKRLIYQKCVNADK